MKVIRDGIWLCSDCLIVAVNGDTSGIDAGSDDATAKRLAAICTGLDDLGPHLVPSFDSATGEGIEEEIGAYCTRQPCACCKTPLHGSRHEFAILGEA